MFISSNLGWNLHLKISFLNQTQEKKERKKNLISSEKFRYSHSNTNLQWKSLMGSHRLLVCKPKPQVGSSNLYLINESSEEKKEKLWGQWFSWNVARVSHEKKHKKANQKINPLERKAVCSKYWQRKYETELKHKFQHKSVYFVF